MTAVATQRADDDPMIRSSLDLDAAEFDRRQEAVRVGAAEREWAGVLAWSVGTSSRDHGEHLLHLANFHCNAAGLPDSSFFSLHGHAALLIPVDGEPVLLTTMLEELEDRARVRDVRFSAHLARGLAACLRDLGMADRPIGVLSESSTPATWEMSEQCDR